MVYNLIYKQIIKFNKSKNIIEYSLFRRYTSNSTNFHLKNFDEKYILNLKDKEINYFFKNNLQFINLINKINTNEHSSINHIRQFLNNLNSGTQLKKLAINLFASTLNSKSNYEVSKRQLTSQKLIAEVIELLNLSYFIHTNILNLKYSNCESRKNILYANKFSILAGDLILAISMQMISSILNNEVTILITNSVNKMTIAQYDFINLNNLIENYDVENWKSLNYEIFGLNMESGCKCLAEIIGMPNSIKNLAGEFGKNFALAYHAVNEFNQFNEFLKKENNLKLISNKLNLFSLPLILDTKNFADLFNEVSKKNNNKDIPIVNIKFIKKYFDIESLKLLKTKKLINFYAKNALQILGLISSLESNKSLVDLIQSFMQN